MIEKYRRSVLILYFGLLSGSVPLSSNPIDFNKLINIQQIDSSRFTNSKITGYASIEIQQLNKSLQLQLSKGNTEGGRLVAESIIQKIDSNLIKDTKTLSESYYFIGVYYSIVKKYHESVKFLTLSESLKESPRVPDERYAKTLYNLGIAFNGLGDFHKYEEYSLKSLEVEKQLFGESSPGLISTYSSIIIANIELQEYEKAISYSNIALTIANNNIDQVSHIIMADLYNNLGGCYNKLADYSKAKIFLDKSESIYKNNHLDLNYNFINLMNNIAIAYGALGLSEKSDQYYEKGIALAESNNSPLAYNLVFSYAIVLANKGKHLKGESLLKGALDRAKTRFGEDSQDYIEVLNNYADYLRENKIDLKKSLECYKKCMDYLRKNERDLLLWDIVHVGYSLTLYEAGETDNALEIIQSLLFSEDKRKHEYDKFDNPGIESIKADMESVKSLKTKYKILWKIYNRSPELKTLEAISNTSELIVSLVERVRINISEEESRLILGDSYRDSYLDVIRDFNLLYTKVADIRFLEKAFEYSEKSKVAGLLTSTRELNAVQFSIPADIADIERKLQRDIGLYSALITEETVSKEPDSIKIINWKESLLLTTRKRDSLVLFFEKQYPEYYEIKYNTDVVRLKDVSGITGYNGNYVSYVASDSILYIFVVNRKHQQLLSVPVDSSFYNKIRQFRKLLSFPMITGNARTAFRDFHSIGYQLYNILIKPIREYLISDRMLISPDNILSYIPFETLPVSQSTGERIRYSDVNYLLNDFDISYSYSATFMAETARKDLSPGKSLIAFAPNYPEPIDIQSVLLNRQSVTGKLNDLPYARQEAEYVAGITGGTLFENDKAKESVFKSESGKYGIIHLAMHTVVNDKEPMYSTLIFSPENDPANDRFLKTYEIYGISLNAKMVVLSSCNTGSGLLVSGEGVLSLARSFIYSGSQSVVMSMWEIEDKSGTEIVKMFYKNLKKGNSKSQALRKARISYLKNANQLRSHPYFWSTLVIYGNNSPLYYPKLLIILGFAAIIIIVSSIIFYFVKRKYS
jgi:CHAT domain-containing protein